MTDHIKNTTVSGLADQISSDRPIPGGGSAAAVAAALAASLVAMVAGLTLKRKKMSDVWAEMEGIASEAESLRDGLLDLAQDDADAFAGVMRSWKIEAGPARDQALERATMTAAEVPLKVVMRALRVLQLAQEVILRGNPTALTDGAVGAELAWAALNGAAHNVSINLGDLPEGRFSSGVASDLAHAREAAGELYEELRRVVAERLG